MAVRLLRPLKCLQVDSWWVLMNHPTVRFCSQAKDPEKPTKKTKAADKTAEAPADRAALLAYKTTVVFPVRLSEPGFFLSPFAAASAAASTSTPTPAPTNVSTLALASEPVSVAAKDVAVFTSDSAESSSSSSSDSESDSDSDSDTEDHKSEVQSGMGPSLPEEPDIQELVVTGRTKDAADAEFEALRPTVKTPTISSDQSDALGPEASAATQDPAELLDPQVPADEAVEAAEGHVAPAVNAATAETPGTVEMPAVNQEKILTDESGEAPSPPAGASEAPVEASTKDCHQEDSEELAESESIPTKAERSKTTPTNATGPLESKCTPTNVASPLESESTPTDTAGPPESESTPTDTAGPPESESTPTDIAGSVELESLAIETVTEVSGPSEELLDPAQVLSESTEKEMVELPSGPSEEPPEPEEPFDNSTYKNYQHHSYTAYTFADQDVEMARYRLPQPSSGKTSPRH